MRTWVIFMTASLLALLPTGEVLAQTSEKARGDWLAQVIAIVLIVGVVVASVMNARRSHQD